MDIRFEDEIIRIEGCTRAEYSYLLSIYNKYRKNYVFDPMYKKKLWDGIDKIMKRETKDQIPLSSYFYLKEKFEEVGYTLNELNDNPLVDKELDFDEFCEWVDEFFANADKFPRDYQIKAAYDMIRCKRCMGMLATSAGKTLISFIVFAYLIMKKDVKNIIMIVPSITLVNQSAGDFETYKKKTLLSTRLKVEKTKNGGIPKHTGIRPTILVSTFQTACKFDSGVYRDYQAIMVDECHKAVCASIRTILDNAKNNHIEYRFGLSGTIPDTKYSDGVSLICDIGSIVCKVSAKELQDQDYISKVSIAQLRLDYTSEEQKQDLANAKALLKGQGKMIDMLQIEKNTVNASQVRLDYIVKLASQCPGNVLILFYEIEYGEKLLNTVSSKTEKKAYYIDGEVKGALRDEIRHAMETENNTVLIGSFGCVSTGFSLTNLHTVMFVSSYKSESLVLQSVGRSLRRNAEIGKTNAKIIDVADELYDNCYQIKQADKRVAMYKEQQFPCKVFRIKL